jgi:FkbM family methyltransferase
MPERFTRHLIEYNALRDDPLVVVDAGSAGGFHPQWTIYGQQAQLIGFDPNDGESHRGNKHRYSVALWHEEGTFPFYVARHGHSSSFYKPFLSRCSQFPWDSTMIIEDVKQVQATTLDRFAAGKDIAVDYIKLDVEGAELAVLKGAHSQLLSSVLGLTVEVLFRPVRKGAPAFHEVDEYLNQRFFDVYHIKGYRHFRRTLSACPFPENRGQMIWADVLFFLDAARLMYRYPQSWPSARVAKMASLLDLMGFPDCAIEVVNAAGELGIIEPKTWTMWRDFLTPLVDGQIVTYAQYREMMNTAIKKAGSGARSIVGEYRRNWSTRI